jgi:hypothetical protein
MANSNSSELLDTFRERTHSANAPAGMRACVQSALKGLAGVDVPVDLSSVMHCRRINEVTFDAGLKYDGHIEPLGKEFDCGFRIVVRGGMPETRLRFTLAHEVCHTFFYELVPEVKYSPQLPHREEERLCNLGAGELLIPSDILAADHLIKYPGLSSLEQLAERYQVSHESMLLRLTSSNLWQCQMIQLYRLANGRFMVDRLFGGSFRNWRMWITDEMNKVWDKPGSRKSGACYASLIDQQRYWGSDRIYYEMKRRGDRLVMLWSPRPLEINPDDVPLFMTPSSEMPASRLRPPKKKGGIPGQPAFLFLGAGASL